jgi:hypothetical protein
MSNYVASMLAREVTTDLANDVASDVARTLTAGKVLGTWKIKYLSSLSFPFDNQIVFVFVFRIRQVMSPALCL